MSLLLALTLTWNLARAAETKPRVFRFHVLTEPSNLDPQLTNSASGNYLYNALYRGLFVYNSKKGLIPAGAKSCERKKGRLICHLNTNYKWSNGETIKALDYVAAFKRLIDPQLSSPQSDILFTLKNAREIWRREKPAEDLGVKAISEDTLEFEFAADDNEFEFKLIHPALSPLPPGGFKNKERATELVASGPYQIAQWKDGAWIRLTRNPFYPTQLKQNRPDAEVLFVENDPTAVSLFEAGKLTFLRRIPAGEIDRFRSKPGFHQIGMARFDYIGFGPQLNDFRELRNALVEGVDFPKFLKLFDTRTEPGCPSLPAKYMDRPYCRKFNLKNAKTSLAKSIKPPKLEFQFSRMGGDDIARAAEFFQGQWQKNLGLEVELAGQEQTLYLRRLRVDPPSIFRKGVNLDRPTCLAALEIFSKDHPENFIHFDEPDFERILKRLASTKDLSLKKRICREGVEFLLNSNRLIPLGEMHFTIMASPEFTGWDLNDLNQLDLSELSETPNKK